MKSGARVLGVDDAPFQRGRDRWTYLVGLLFRGPVLERAVKRRVAVDGDDATRAVIDMVDGLSGEVKLIMSHGTVTAGFNVLDLWEIYGATSVPIISVVDRMPDMERVRRALEHRGLEERMEVLSRNPNYVRVRTRMGEVYACWVGIGEREVVAILNRTCVESRLPEPVRIAHIVAGLLSDPPGLGNGHF